MPVTQTFGPAGLDDATRRYLRCVYDAGGDGCNGAFFPQPTGWSVFGLILGAAAPACAAALLVPRRRRAFAFPRPLRVRQVRAALVVGAVALASSFHTLHRRRDRGSYLGTFTLIDPAYAWEVDAHRAKATSLTRLAGATVAHQFERAEEDPSTTRPARRDRKRKKAERKYQSSALILRTDAGAVRLTVYDRDRAG